MAADADRPAYDAAYQRARRVVHRSLRGTVWVAGPGREISSLSGSAAAVWAALVVPASAHELAEAVAEVFPDVDDPRAEVEAALDALRRASLVEVVQDGTVAR